jgi:hypothetical protein
MNADVRTSLQATAIAMATSSTLWEIVVVHARRTWMRMAFAMTSTIAWVLTTLVAFAMVPEQSMNVVAVTSLRVNATAKETLMTQSACAAAPAKKTLMTMASATFLTLVLVLTMLAVCAMVQVKSMSVDAGQSQLVIAIAMATNWMLWGNVEVDARPIWMVMAFAMTLMIVWVSTTNVASAMAMAPLEIAVVRTFPLVIAIATGINWMQSVNAVGIALQMSIQTAFVMTSILAWVRWIRATCAMGPGRFTIVDVLTSLLATAIAMATSSTPWAFVEALAMLMWTRMEFAIQWTRV